MRQSHTIDINSKAVGFAISIDRGYRFVATDIRMEELDSSIWPSLADVRRVACRVYQDAISAGPVSPSLHARAYLNIATDD